MNEQLEPPPHFKGELILNDLTFTPQRADTKIPYPFPTFAILDARLTMRGVVELLGEQLCREMLIEALHNHCRSTWVAANGDTEVFKKAFFNYGYNSVKYSRIMAENLKDAVVCKRNGDINNFKQLIIEHSWLQTRQQLKMMEEMKMGIVVKEEEEESEIPTK